MAAPRGRQQAPAADDGGPVYVDEHHQRFSEFADDYLDEDEREGFVEHLMDRHGYQRTTGWGPRQQQDDDHGNDDRGNDGSPDGLTGDRRGGRPAGQRQPRRQPYFRR